MNNHRSANVFVRPNSIQTTPSMSNRYTSQRALQHTRYESNGWGFLTTWISASIFLLVTTGATITAVTTVVQNAVS